MRTFVNERSRLYHVPWHRAVEAAAARLDLEPLLATNPPAGFVPDFLTPPPSHAVADARRTARRDPGHTGRAGQGRARALPGVERRWFLPRRSWSPWLRIPPPRATCWRTGWREAWDALVAPYWPRIEELIEADIGYRSHRLVTLGLRGILDGLHPGVRWEDGAVEVDGPDDTEVDLAGRGLVLMPSAYAWPVVTAIVEGPWQPTSSTRLAESPSCGRYRTPPSRALARLLGQTRALLLVSLERPTSTTALAARLGRSTSGVSGHLLALRDAGLVTASRRGHEVPVCPHASRDRAPTGVERRLVEGGATPVTACSEPGATLNPGAPSAPLQDHARQGVQQASPTRARLTRRGIRRCAGRRGHAPSVRSRARRRRHRSARRWQPRARPCDR